MKNNIRILFVTSIATMLFSCKKETVNVMPCLPAQTEMTYINLHEKVVKRNAPAIVLDLNLDGQYDLVFGVQLVGDPLLMVDKTQFLVSSSFYTNLPINTNEEILPLSKLTTIPLSSFNGHTWYNVGSTVLMEKVEDIHSAITWNGVWKNVAYKYLPIQVTQNDKRYNGWVELSTNTQDQQLILHRAALSKFPEKEVQAGL